MFILRKKEIEEEEPASPNKEILPNLEVAERKIEAVENYSEAASPSVESPTSPPKSPAKKIAPNFACSTPLHGNNKTSEANFDDDDSEDDVIAEEQSTVTSLENDDTLTQHGLMLGRNRRLNRENRSILSGGIKQGWTKDNAGNKYFGIFSF